jgi:hypothetical protein
MKAGEVADWLAGILFGMLVSVVIAGIVDLVSTHSIALCGEVVQVDYIEQEFAMYTSNNEFVTLGVLSDDHSWFRTLGVGDTVFIKASEGWVFGIDRWGYTIIHGLDGSSCP